MFSIVVPARNEEKILGETVFHIREEAGKIGEFEIIIVEESSDKTPEIASSLARKYPEIKHVHNLVRLGKGGAIERGVLESKGDKIVFMDADLSTELSALPSIISGLDSFDVVVGSRFHPQSVVRRPFYRIFLGYTLALLARLLVGVQVKDTQCGFKGFRRDVITTVMTFVKNKEWFWDIEMLYYANKFGYRIHETPVVWTECRKNEYRLIQNIFSQFNNLIKLFLRENVVSKKR